MQNECILAHVLNIIIYLQHGTFIEYPLECPVWKRVDHTCDNSYPKELVVVDEKGIVNA